MLVAGCFVLQTYWAPEPYRIFSSIQGGYAKYFTPPALALLTICTDLQQFSSCLRNNHFDKMQAL